MRGKAWGSNDRAGGPIDEVLDTLRATVPDLFVERLEVSNKADDDNVYFLGDSLGHDFLQIGTHPNGEPPFFVEATDRFEERFETSQVSDVATRVAEWFRERREAGPSTDPGWIGPATARVPHFPPKSAPPELRDLWKFVRVYGHSDDREREDTISRVSETQLSELVSAITPEIFT